MKCFTVWFESGISDLLYKEFVSMFAALNAKVHCFGGTTPPDPPPECCDESKQDLRDWIECGFKFCPYCGRKLRP